MTENVITLNAHDETATALVATIRGAVNGVGKYAAYAAAHEHLTHATVKDHALALAVLAYPKAKQVQKVDGKRTLFGNAVQAAGAGLRNALGAEEKATKPPVLRVSLSGEGGGTVVIAPDHAMYADLVAMIAPVEQADESTDAEAEAGRNERDALRIAS